MTRRSHLFLRDSNYMRINQRSLDPSSSLPYIRKEPPQSFWDFGLWGTRDGEVPESRVRESDRKTCSESSRWRSGTRVLENHSEKGFCVYFTGTLPKTPSRTQCVGGQPSVQMRTWLVTLVRPPHKLYGWK